jgi:putative ABC transport system substrate-binding protein
MRRREFVKLAVGSAPWAFAAHAQQSSRMFVFTTSQPSEMEGAEPPHPSVRAFVDRLRELGYREGENLLLERRTAEGRLDKLPDIISALVTEKTDVMLLLGTLASFPL